jgi:hypothetical protein
MKLDKKLLAGIKYSENAKDGLCARFHADGSLAYFAFHRDGLPYKHMLTIDAKGKQLQVMKGQFINYPSDEEDAKTMTKKCLQEMASDFIKDIALTAQGARCNFCGASNKEAAICCNQDEQNNVCESCAEFFLHVLKEDAE